MARILLYRRQFAEAIPHVERALTLNPNDPDVLIHAALCRVYLGEGEAALALAQKAMRLNPCYPAVVHGAGRNGALPARSLRQVDRAERAHVHPDVRRRAGLSGRRLCTGWRRGRRETTICSGFSTTSPSASPSAAGLNLGEPLRWLLHINPFRREQDAERWARGLRIAGLENDPDEERPEAVAHAAGPGGRRDVPARGSVLDSRVRGARGAVDRPEGLS